MKFDLSFLVQHEPTKDSPSSLKAPKQPSHSQATSTAMTGATLLQVATAARTTKTSPSPPQTSSVPLPPSSMEITSSSSSPQQHPQLGSSVRSASIPLPSSHIDRTQSELQLCVDEAAAEQRELTMFYRVVNGIRERQQTMAAAHPYPPPTQSRPTPASHSVPYHPTNHKNPRSFHGANGVDETESSYHTAVPLHDVEDTHSPPEDDAMDSWSITGYSEHDGAVTTAMIPPFEEQQATYDPSDPNEEEADAEEMGIFALDL